MRALGHSVAAVTALAAAPLAAGALAVRPGWRCGAGERLGAVAAAPGGVWVHGASVGELLAATRLVDALRDGGRRVVVSAQTPAGRAVLRAARPGVPCQLAPIDHPWCVERALARARPAALVLIESELWPCWIAAADRRGVPVVLVSGRVSDGSFARYRRIRPFVARTLRRLRAVGARTAEDAERLRALGARPQTLSISGDLKLDGASRPRALAADLVRALAGASLFVAGSTHPGEERAALAALAAIEGAGLAASLVLAPRRPARAREVAELVRAAGRAVRRRSALGTELLRPGEVLLLDSLGELPALYARADVAFVGGSLVPKGGHNILEPVQCGRPVLFGPYTRNVDHAAAILEGCGAGRRVGGAGDLGRAAVALLADSEGARRRGARGREALARHGGSSRRALRIVERALAETATGAGA